MQHVNAVTANAGSIGGVQQDERHSGRPDQAKRALMTSYNRD
jgi:hypothetical protein